MDPPGPRRKERKAAAYAILAEVDASTPRRLALVVKAADRLANVRACLRDANEGLLAMYRREHHDFAHAVSRQGLNDAFMNELDELLRQP
jgi:hypothetical protein